MSPGKLIAAVSVTSLFVGAVSYTLCRSLETRFAMARKIFTLGAEG